MKFIQVWCLVQLAKLLVAARLPVFVDEAFYAWEGRHLAWAYSDLPGLTAWLARLGETLGNGHPLGLRLPFLLLGGAVPWLVWSLSRRWFDERIAAQAGLLATLMPLSGWLGVLAVPDASLVFAALLAIVAIARLRDRVDGVGLAGLALALVLGALSHYRFVLVLFAGLVGIVVDPRARRLLFEPRVWGVLAIGALAWLPLLQWNLAHAGAGVRFQFVERNPWQFHADGLSWWPIQFLLVTPALFVLLLATLRGAWLRRDDASAPWRLLGVVGLLAAPAFAVFALFVDAERVSFHWPLAGWLVLLTGAPVLLASWPRWARAAVHAGAALGLLLGLAFLVVASSPGLRTKLADSKLYPNDFAGWSTIVARAGTLPGDTVLVASDFELAAQLSFALRRNDIFVLDSPLNHKHGRAAQLQDWGLLWPSMRAGDGPLVLIVDDSATPMKRRLEAYHSLCRQFGRLPPAEVLNVDHGRKRYLVYRLSRALTRGACVAPALAWVDAPLPKHAVDADFEVTGWAFKDGVGLREVQVLIDGKPAATADYGVAMPNVAGYWRDSSDPNHPRVGFRARVAIAGLEPGVHWLGLRLHGADGAVEDWPEQRVDVRPR